MKKLFFFVFTFSIFYQISFAQKQYFPPQNEWATKSPSDFGINAEKLKKAVDFAEANEYSGAKDLRVAILKGFSHEPYHQILGKTKKRGGPAGVILKNGYIVAQWGNVNRVDMTFSVTKSYLSTVCGLAIDAGLITDVNNKVGEMIWDGTFDGVHNNKITWDHLLTQSSDWSGSLWGGKDWADRPPKTGGVDDWKIRKFNEPGTVMEYNDVRVNVLAFVGCAIQVPRK